MNNKTIFSRFIQDFCIEIPRIQRDYVQGRAITSEQAEKRDDFVNNMISALEDKNKTCVLDFVYGFTSGDINSRIFIPLDGQQRLTSLYLLHWYLLFLLKKKEIKLKIDNNEVEDYDKDNSKMSLLKGRFSYNNRISSTEFCKRLTSFENGAFNWEIEGSIKDVILEQAWFDDEWMCDPTIETMLEMLLVIEGKLKSKKYDELKAMTERLFNEEAIFFDKLNLEDLHQGESLYVKMNARGKKMTQFENWKSKFTKMLEDFHKDEEFDCGDKNRCGLKYKDYFSYSVEHDWNDIFWHFVTKGKMWNTIEDVMNSSYPTVDRAFSNFLKFIHAICFFYDRNDKNAKVGDFKWTFLQNEETYGEGKIDNIKFLFQCLDFLSSINSFDDFFNAIFYIKSNNTDSVQSHKVRLNKEHKEQTNINLFELAIGYYCPDEKSKEIINNREDPSKFDLTSNYLLWAILNYCAPKYCASRTPFVVDDALRNYVRECRNKIEMINQFLRGPVTLSPNIRITDANANLKQLIETKVPTKYSDNQVQDMYEWLGDFDYVGGQALAFVPILDDIEKGTTNITLNMIKNFMCSFDKASTLERVQMFIGAGYIGKKDIGSTGNRERVFFGQKTRWNVLFVEDSIVLCDCLRKLIKDFANNYTVEALLNHYRILCKKDTFAYYMLNYDYALWAPNNPSAKHEDSDNGEYYYAISGDLDNMDIIALRSLSNNPLSAYHIDPLVCAVIHNCLSNHPNLSDKIKYIGRYGTKHGISIPNKINNELDEFCLISNKNGWTIQTDTMELENIILNANPQLSYNNGIFELMTNNIKETDKVKIGEAILETIAKYFKW